MGRARIALVIVALALVTTACEQAVSGPRTTLRPGSTGSGGQPTTAPGPTGPASTPVASTPAPTSVPTTDTTALAPPIGHYRCYLVPNFTYLSYVELLPGGRYEAGYTRGEPSTSGSYAYSAASNQVLWSGGEYEEVWPVAYYVQPGVYPDGSTREGTGADRHTIALKVDHSNPRLPGQEVGNNPIYVYCYQEEAG